MNSFQSEIGLYCIHLYNKYYIEAHCCKSTIFCENLLYGGPEHNLHEGSCASQKLLENGPKSLQVGLLLIWTASKASLSHKLSNLRVDAEFWGSERDDSSFSFSSYSVQLTVSNGSVEGILSVILRASSVTMSIRSRLADTWEGLADVRSWASTQGFFQVDFLNFFVIYKYVS